MSTRIRLRVLPALLPQDGRNVELQATDTFIQWRYEGEADWTDLIALTEITGPAGPNIELQSDGTNIQWRAVGDVAWNDLIPLSAITGAPGPEGPTGPGLEDGDKGDVTVSSSGTSWVIDNNVVTNAKMADMATATIKGRSTAGTGAPEDLTPAQVLTLTGASAIGRAINGLLISNNSTTPNTKIDISPGSCRDKDQTIDMVLATGWTKTTGAWVAATGNGMLDTGTVAADKGYHVFLIYNPTSGLYDFLCSLSATAPTMPSGFTKRRRIGAFVTGTSAVIKPGLWYADGMFRFLDAFDVVSGVAGNVLTLKALPIPLGVKLKVFGQAFGSASPDVGFWIIIRDPDVGTIANVATQWYDAQIYKKLGSNDGSAFDSWTDTSGQIYHVAYPRTATNLIYIYLQGWIDLREEFA
jgi:hypothetical protein